MTRVKKTPYSILLIALSIAMLASCATKPKTPEPQPVVEPQPAPVVQPVTEPSQAVSQTDLDKLLAEAKELKKKAFDLKLFEVLPDDYKAADSLLASGQKAYDDKDASAAKTNLDSAIAAYKDLIAKGIVDIADAKRKEAEEMKASAVKAGADSSQTERFGSGDKVFDAAVALVDGKKTEEAISGFEQAKLYYELSWKRAVASELKQTIEDKDFAKWDSGNYQLADTKYQSEDGFWASGKEEDRVAGKDALYEAILRFNLVIQKGQEMAVGTVKEKTDESKARSEEIKANVAVKDQYESALELYSEGSEKLANKEYEAASDSYDRAGKAFDEAYAAAAEKRAKAEEAINAAKEATSESQRKAEEADPLLESAR